MKTKTYTDSKGRIQPACITCGTARKHDWWSRDKLAINKKYFVENAYECMPCKKGIKQSKPAVEAEVKEQVVKVTPTVYGGELAKQIPPKCNYIPRKIGDSTDVNILLQAWEHRNDATQPYTAVKIEGETGGGKTMACEYVAWKLQVPYISVNCNGGTTPEDLIGQWVPSDAGFKWADGKLTTFMRNGGIFVVDEINMAKPNVSALLNPVLDDRKQLVLTQKSGEIVKAHPNFFVIATMNPDYEGTNPLNEALTDRMLPMEFDWNSAAERKLIKNPALHQVAKKLRAAKRKGELETPFGTRQLLMYQKNCTVFGKQLAKYFALQRFPPDERQAVEEVFDLCNKEVA